jgi:hypothetical protein
VSKFVRRYWNDLIWIGWLLAFAMFEGRALLDTREGDTLSERTREWFRTNKSPLGRQVFGWGWVAFSGWFLWHILWQHQ